MKKRLAVCLWLSRTVVMGSTGLLELTKDYVNGVVVNLLSGIDEQKRVSETLGSKEASKRQAILNAQLGIENARTHFSDV